MTMHRDENRKVREVMDAMEHKRRVFNSALQYGMRERIVTNARELAEKLTALADELEGE